MTMHCTGCLCSDDDGDDEAPESARWVPDEQLVPAILAGGPQTMRDLSPPDRSWVVAGLRLKGLTAAEIADRLRPCSLRQIRAINAEPMTAVCMMYQVERENFANTNRMSETDVRRLSAELAEALSAAARYKRQLDIMLDLHVTGEAGAAFVCGCPKTKYNTYVYVTKDGKTKTSCRTHRTLAVAASRERQRQQIAQHPVGVDSDHGEGQRVSEARQSP